MECLQPKLRGRRDPEDAEGNDKTSTRGCLMSTFEGDQVVRQREPLFRQQIFHGQLSVVVDVVGEATTVNAVYRPIETIHPERSGNGRDSMRAPAGLARENT